MGKREREREMQEAEQGGKGVRKGALSVNELFRRYLRWTTSGIFLKGGRYFIFVTNRATTFLKDPQPGSSCTPS